MKWSKEEIMAYVDGQLPEEEILRIEEAINQDSNAKDYYNALTDSNELIDITYNTIEKSYVSRTNQAKTTLSNKQNEKNIYPQNTNSIAISLRGVFGKIATSRRCTISTWVSIRRRASSSSRCAITTSGFTRK